jgi:hypothetical protein
MSLQVTIYPPGYQETGDRILEYIRRLSESGRYRLGSTLVELSGWVLSNQPTTPSPTNLVIGETLKFAGDSIISGNFDPSKLALTGQDFLAAGIEIRSDTIIGAAFVAGISCASLMILGPTTLLGGGLLLAGLRSSLSRLVPYAPLLLAFLGKKVRGVTVDLLKSIFGDEIESKINLITQLAPRRADWAHRLVLIYQAGHVAQCHPFPERSLPA